MRTRVVVVAAAAFLAATALAQGQERTYTVNELKSIGEGRAVYLTYCTSCHGPFAHGGSTATEEPAPDLTLVAVRDGRFDTLHVSNRVGGRYADRKGAMPRWSKVMRRNPDGKVLAVTRYLAFIQQPEGGPQAKQ